MSKRRPPITEIRGGSLALAENCGPRSAQLTEAQLHRAVASFLRVALKSPTTWTTIPAGGGGRIRGAQLKAMGLQPGWPDLIVLHPAGHSHRGATVVGLELKTDKGRPSKAQQAMDSQFFCAGAYYYVARSVDEVEGFLRGVGIPLHARIAA